MSESETWITQTKAAELKGMTLPAINMLVSRKRIRSKEVYGKVLVSRADVMAYTPTPRNERAKKRTAKRGSKK